MLITGLLLGTALGFVMQRGRFCVTGAFRDIWLSRNTRWLTAFMLVVAIQSVGVFALDAAGVITLQEDAFAWLATILGAFIFGFGIILAGGCATGTYYRSGEGLVGSWIALAAYALFAAISKSGPLAGTTDALRSVTVPLTNFHTTLGVSPWVPVAFLLTGVGLAVRHQLRKPKLNIASLPSQRTGVAKALFDKHWGAFTTAVVIGVIAILAWPLSWATGRESGLGITTPSSNLASFFITGDVELVDWGVLLVLGLLVGSFIAAKASGEFKVRVPDSSQAVRSIGGGALMGIGAAWAGGCTIGNAMVNTAVFGYQGWVSLVFMIIGTGVAARIFITPGSNGKNASTTTALATARVS
ncbi:YeeE/YedE family protein [Arthrobacter roseus]|uniref:YeeE/YedE family protein n=1 Tax=Arthrobacter roseus TaxID=136274 RepID=UPI001EF76234|nr:YeeE/YedE family protein [Arthrobacter roseus]MBM7847082.1 putative membrane protein YedE/YeeE [Arthrobacter roseus]